MPIWELVVHSSPIAMMVLLLLGVFSFLSWAIIFLKWQQIRKAAQTSAEFSELFWRVRQLDDVYEKSQQYSHSPVAKLFRNGYDEIAKIQALDQEQGKKPNFGPETIESVQHALRRTKIKEISELEKLVPFLATVGSTSPFIGLFGTVVGIMSSFSEIGAKGSANIATVAPGIAEALVATAAGLLAAIPAVIAYNHFAVKIKNIATEMDSFAGDYLNILKRHLS